MPNRFALSHGVLLVLYFLSGATALAYEIVWSRNLEVVLGSSSLAVSSILASFMGGLALGSAWLGRIRWVSHRPLAAYALLEITIGLYAYCTPWLQSSVLQQISGGVLKKYFLSILVYFPPTVLMGATFPAVTYALARHRVTSGTWAGLAYGTNTAGAAIGAFAAGFFLIPWIGLVFVNHAAAAVNIAVGCMAIFVRIPVEGCSHAIRPAAELKPQRQLGRIAAASLFILGASSMICEVLWARYLSLVLGSSTYAFTVVLVTFLTGLAAGSLLVSRWTASNPRPVIWTMSLQLVLAVIIFSSLPLMDRLPLAYYELYRKLGSEFWKIELIQFLLAGLVLFPPALLIGGSFPCLMKIALTTADQWRPRIGILYGINALGDVAGAVAGSLVLLPAAGIQEAVRTAMKLHLLIIPALALYGLKRRFWTATFALSAVLLAVLSHLAPAWNLKVLTAGIPVYAQKYAHLDIRTPKLKEEISKSKILYSRDGWTSHVTVREYGNVRSLLINGKADGSDGQDLETELLAAHLPLLMHRQPRDVFVIGLGTGITLRAAAKHSLKDIDCVEIEKRVVEAAAYFEHANQGVLSDPRVRLIINDARHVLASSAKKYACIISEPSNPWLAGIGALYTVEMFKEIEEHLKPGGIVCQWIHYYNMSSSDLKTVVRTFQTVFPNASLWGQAHLSDLFLIASKPGSQSPEILTRRTRDAEVRKDLAAIGLEDARALSSLRLLDHEQARRYAGNGPVNADALPILEFSAPRHLYEDTMSRNLSEILSYRRVRKQDRFYRAMGRQLNAMIHFYENDAAGHLQGLKRAAELAPEWKRLMQLYEEAAYQQARHLSRTGSDEESLRLLLDAAGILPPSARIHYSIGYFYQMKRDLDKAVSHYEKAVGADPQMAPAYNNLGAIYLSHGRTPEAYSALRKALEIDPLYLEAHLNLAYCLLRQKALLGAELEFKLCIKLNPNLSSAYNGLGVVYAMQKKHKEAHEQFRQALEMDPKNAEALKNLKKVIEEMQS